MSRIDDEMAGLRVAKKELRGLMRQRLSQLPEESLFQQSNAATHALLSMPEYQNANRIGIYLSMPKGEMSTGAIVTDAFGHRKQVFVPYLYKTHPKDQGKPQSVMEMVSLHSISDWEGLSRDAWGIPTVPEKSVVERQRVLGDKHSDNDHKEGSQNDIDKKTGTEKLDMIIMPGMAFDRGLSRLGHGKGFYDYFLQRYLSSKDAPMPFLVGLALDVQLLQEPQKIPTDASDWRLDALVVGNGTVVRR